MRKRVEIFSYYNTNVHNLQDAVNVFLGANEHFIEVVNILQTESEGTITITVVYVLLQETRQGMLGTEFYTNYVDKEGTRHTERIVGRV